MASGSEEDISLYVIPLDTPVNKLDCTEAFNGLTDKEKLYAHHFGRACWEGGLICLLQTSPESPGIFLLLGELFRGQSLQSLRELASGCGLSDDEYNVSNRERERVVHVRREFCVLFENQVMRIIFIIKCY